MGALLPALLTSALSPHLLAVPTILPVLFWEQGGNKVEMVNRAIK
jgi:hypothetical protein